MKEIRTKQQLIDLIDDCYNNRGYDISETANVILSLLPDYGSHVKEDEITRLREDNYELSSELESEKEKFRLATILAAEYKAWVEKSESEIKRLQEMLELAENLLSDDGHSSPYKIYLALDIIRESKQTLEEGK